MALTDEVQTRLAAQELKNLTNPDAPESASAIDSARLAAAAADAEGDFVTYGNQDYDGTDARHVAIGVSGVIAYLKLWGAASSAKAQAELEKFHARLERLAKIGPRQRVTPSTSSTLVPTSYDADPPAFDKDRFTEVAPNPPPAPEDS